MSSGFANLKQFCILQPLMEEQAPKPEIILNHEQVVLKLERLAYEVYEQHYDAPRIVIAGVEKRGALLAELIHQQLSRWFKGELIYSSVHIDKEDPEDSATSLGYQQALSKETRVVLCDDVVYKGRTLFYACKPFMNSKVTQLQCLALVHRDHHHYPVQPRFVGLALATTLQQHVKVELEELYKVSLL